MWKRNRHQGTLIPSHTVQLSASFPSRFCLMLWQPTTRIFLALFSSDLWKSLFYKMQGGSRDLADTVSFIQHKAEPCAVSQAEKWGPWESVRSHIWSYKNIQLASCGGKKKKKSPSTGFSAGIPRWHSREQPHQHSPFSISGYVDVGYTYRVVYADKGAPAKTPPCLTW